MDTATAKLPYGTKKSLFVSSLDEVMHQRITVFTSSGRAITGELLGYDIAENDIESCFRIGPKVPGGQISTIRFEEISMFRPARDDE